jgi:hypothetical protein
VGPAVGSVSVSIRGDDGAVHEGREAALAGEMPAREAGSGGLGRADPRWVEMAMEIRSLRGHQRREPTRLELSSSSIGHQAARRWTSQMVAAMSSTDSASSQPPSIHWNGQNRVAGW